MIKTVEKAFIVIVLAGLFLCKGSPVPSLGSTPMYLIAMVLLGCIVAARKLFLENKQTPIKGIGVVSILIVLNVILVSIFNEVDTGRILLIVFSFLFLWACKENMEKEEEVRFFYKWYIFLVAISSLFAIGQYFEIPFCTTLWQSLHTLTEEAVETSAEIVPDAINEKRYLGLASDALMFGYQASTAFILTLFMDFKEKKFIKFILLALFVFAIFVNNTRSSWIAVAVAVFLYIFNLPDNYSKRVKICIRFLATALMIFVILISSIAGLDVFTDTRFEQVDAGTSARVPMILTAFNHAINRPFGYGVYSVDPDLIVGAESEEFSYVAENTAHNLFGNCVASYGFIGLFLMIYLYWTVFKEYRIISKTDGMNTGYYYAAIVCVFGLMINAFFHNSYILNGEISSFLFFGVIAAGMSSINKSRREK